MTASKRAHRVLKYAFVSSALQVTSRDGVLYNTHMYSYVETLLRRAAVRRKTKPRRAPPSASLLTRCWCKIVTQATKITLTFSLLNKNMLNYRYGGNAASRGLNMSKWYVEGKEDGFSFIQRWHFDRGYSHNHRHLIGHRDSMHCLLQEWMLPSTRTHVHIFVVYTNTHICCACSPPTETAGNRWHKPEEVYISSVPNVKEGEGGGELKV